MKYLFLFGSVLASTAFAQAPTLNAPLTKMVPVITEAVSSTPEWSPPADYHHAAVIISVNSQQGSGVLIKHTGKGIVAITNRHVVRRGDNVNDPTYADVTLRSQNGNTFLMEVLATSIEYDLAILKSHRDDITAKVSLPLGNYEVPGGEKIELVGFGGPDSKLRHFYGKRLTSLSIDAITISGDSGSPLIYGGAVVGINYGGAGAIGTSTDNRGSPWDLIYPASSFVSGPILCRWVNQHLYQQTQGQCQPYIQQSPYGSPYQQSPPSGYQFHPPSNQQPLPDQSVIPNPPAVDQPPTPTPSAKVPTIDEILDELVQRQEFKDLKGEDGEDGKDGLDGVDGEDGLDGKDAQITPEIINSIVMAVTSQVLDNIPEPEPVPTMEEIVDAVIQQIPGCQCDNHDDSVNTPPTDTIVDSTPDAPTKYLESNRVLYFTATSCVSCFETTNLVNSLKRSGYPITIITLTTSMAEANQVPQVFVPATGQRAMGPSRVKEFLSNISL